MLKLISPIAFFFNLANGELQITPVAHIISPLDTEDRSFRSERKRSYKNGIIKSIWCLFQVQQKGIPCICEQLLFDYVKSNSKTLTGKPAE